MKSSGADPHEFPSNKSRIYVLKPYQTNREEKTGGACFAGGSRYSMRRVMIRTIVVVIITDAVVVEVMVVGSRESFQLQNHLLPKDGFTQNA